MHCSSDTLFPPLVSAACSSCAEISPSPDVSKALKIFAMSAAEGAMLSVGVRWMRGIFLVVTRGDV